MLSFALCSPLFGALRAWGTQVHHRSAKGKAMAPPLLGVDHIHVFVQDFRDLDGRPYEIEPRA
jgi:hypothetical protein